MTNRTASSSSKANNPDAAAAAFGISPAELDVADCCELVLSWYCGDTPMLLALSKDTIWKADWGLVRRYWRELVEEHSVPGTRVMTVACTWFATSAWAP